MLTAVWPPLAVWVALSGIDRALAIACEKQYRAGANRHFVRVKARVDPAATGSRFAFVVKILGGAFFLAFARGAASRHDPWLFEALVGGLILIEPPFVLARLQTYLMYRHGSASDGITGSITYEEWFLYRIFVAHMISFAALYGFLFALTGRVFLAGGAASSLSIGLYCWKIAKRPRGPVPQPAE